MQLLRVSPDVSLAFGMSWEGFDGIEGSLTSQIKKWRNRGFKVACHYEREGDMIYGLDADRVERDGTRLVSGAALIASHPILAGKSGLVVLEVKQGDQPLVIVVGLKLGVVIVDKLVSVEEAAGVRNAFASELPTGATLETWGQVDTIAAVDHLLPFKELITISVKRNWYGAFTAGSSEIRTLRSNQPIIIGVATLGVMGLAGGVWFLWGFFSEEAEAAKRAKDIALNSPTVLYQNNVERLLQTPINPLGESVAVVRGHFATFPVLYQGYQLLTINCFSKACDVTWTRMQGTFEEFEKAAAIEHPEWTGLSLIDIDKLTHSIAIELPTTKLPAMASWPKERIYRNETFSHWQYLQPGTWKAALNKALQQALPSGLKPEQEIELASFPNAPFAMSMEIAKQPWWYADDDPLSPTKRFGETAALVGPISLDFDGRQISFTAKGNIYVQR